MSEYFDRENAVESFVAAVRQVVIAPGAFFEGMPRAQGYGPSLIFLSIVLGVVILIYALMTMGVALLAAPLVWVLAIVATWLWAWYLGWAVRVFARKDLSTMDAFQICAYANVPVLIGWIPVLGLLSSLWSLALEWIGLTRFAGVSSGTALLILLVPLVLLMLSGALLVVLIGALATQQVNGLPWQSF